MKLTVHDVIKRGELPSYRAGRQDMSLDLLSRQLEKRSRRVRLLMFSGREYELQAVRGNDLKDTGGLSSKRK